MYALLDGSARILRQFCTKPSKKDDIICMSGEGNDGRIVLTFFNNNLEVRGDFFPAGEGGSPITDEYLRDTLERSNIVYGIQHEEILNAFTECIQNSTIVRDVLIAKGEAPVNGVVEYMQLNPFLGQKSDIEEGSAVDHRARSSFVVVKKDQALAKMKRPKPGKEGKNVHGEAIPQKIENPEGVSGGANTRMEDRFLLSNINGQLVITKGVISVTDFLLIKGSVGYGTGNIIFPGNVEIHGAVSDGFKIYSGGSVLLKQTFDVTEAVTKNDLTVLGGIIGRGRGMVKVGGILKTKFIENCRVACRNTVYVDTEIVNSKVYTLDTLRMGDKGKIVGGELYAVKGLYAAAIGRKTGKATRIHCGIDFTVEQEKEKTNGILKMLAAKIAQVQETIAAGGMSAEKTAKMEAFLVKLQEEQQKAQLKVSELLGKLNTHREAIVEVKGEIAPGTLIEICQIALFVTEPLKKVRVKINPNTNKLMTEKM